MTEKRHRIAQHMSQRAKSLRREMTGPERALWRVLRDGPLKFRRQVVIGLAIVDFYCPAAALVVEVDGLSHDDRKMQDDARAKELMESGLRVLRFTNDEVLSDVDVVAVIIFREAQAHLAAQAVRPSPTPP